jgi:hypothetical protein
MKKEDAELKAKALAKDLVEKEAEHKGSLRKCTIRSVEAVAKSNDKTNFEVLCFFEPLENEMSGKTLTEEIGYFLSTYRILDLLSSFKKSRLTTQVYRLY